MSVEAWERYEVRLRNLGPENDDYWLAEIPQLDGCKAYGKTQTEALEALQDVAQMFIEIAEEDEEQLPLPLAEVPHEYSGRFVVRVTSSLHKALAERAKVEGVSLNHLCYELLALGIGERRALRPIYHYHLNLALPNASADLLSGMESFRGLDRRNLSWTQSMQALGASIS